MSRTAKFKYKCRMCGLKYDSGEECGEQIAFNFLIGALHDIPVNNSPGVQMTTYHKCGMPGDMWMGVADLIGYELVKDE